MYSVAEGCELRAKYTALAIEHILPNGRLAPASPESISPFRRANCQPANTPGTRRFGQPTAPNPTGRIPTGSEIISTAEM